MPTFGATFGRHSRIYATACVTTLVSWFGRDQRGPASIYIAADSRITWPATPHSTSARWDRGRKVFASKLHPEMFGYCGDVLFPTQLLGQALDLLDRNLLIDVALPASEKVVLLRDFIDASLATYTAAMTLRFELVYASRGRHGMDSEFSLYRLVFDKGQWATTGPIQFPYESAMLLNLGSGSRSVESAHRDWQSSSSQGTSRAVFSAFCDALTSGRDLSSGGPPQLVGLRRIGPARVFGFVGDGKRYVLGSELVLPGGGNFEWFNAGFERCDPSTLHPLPRAQRQPRPKDLPGRK